MSLVFRDIPVETGEGAQSALEGKGVFGGSFCVSRSLSLGSVCSCSVRFLLWNLPSGEDGSHLELVGLGKQQLSLGLF